MQRVVIFCDGASKGNPGPGGWAAIVASDTQAEELAGREERTTNNRMELRAALEALSRASMYRPDEIDVYTDSAYVIGGATKWGAGWKRNGWITATKQPVLNRDLWEVLLHAAEHSAQKIRWHNIGGHVGIPGNERVDALASDRAEGKPVTLFRGSRAKYPIDLANIEHDESLAKKKSASRARSSAKAYAYVSEVDGEVMIHKTWAECEARVKGKKARFKKALTAEEEKSIVEAFSR